MTAERPTIFCVMGSGWSLRNYLWGQFLPALTRRADVVIGSPIAASREFVSKLQGEGVCAVVPIPLEMSPFQRRFRARRREIHYRRQETDTMRLRHEYLTAHRGEFRFRAGELVNRGLGLLPPKWLDRLDRRIAESFGRVDRYTALLREHNADVVFASSYLYPAEWDALHAARSLGIPTALAVPSWDNLSSKDRLPLPVDALFVWSDDMADEFATYYSEYRSRMRVIRTGSPGFDHYFDPSIESSRAETWGRRGLDPSRPVVVYATVTPTLMPNEPRIVADLARRLADSGRQLYVRVHPADPGDRYRTLNEEFPNLRMEIPGRGFDDFRLWQPTGDPWVEQTNTLRHADVVLNVASTVTLDAAVLDRPVINIGYDLSIPGDRPSLGLLNYQYTHFRPLVDAGAFPVVGSPEELIAWLDRYLKNPGLHAYGRRAIAERKCGPLDGRSAGRTAAALVNLAAGSSVAGIAVP